MEYTTVPLGFLISYLNCNLGLDSASMTTTLINFKSLESFLHEDFRRDVLEERYKQFTQDNSSTGIRLEFENDDKRCLLAKTPTIENSIGRVWTYIYSAYDEEVLKNFTSFSIWPCAEERCIGSWTSRRPGSRSGWIKEVDWWIFRCRLWNELNALIAQKGHVIVEDAELISALHSSNCWQLTYGFWQGELSLRKRAADKQVTLKLVPFTTEALDKSTGSILQETEWRKLIRDFVADLASEAEIADRPRHPIQVN